MKIQLTAKNKMPKTVKAVSPKAAKAKVVKAKVKASKKAQPVKVENIHLMIALLTGARSAGAGGSARLVEVGTRNGITVIRPTQARTNIGSFKSLDVESIPWAEVIGGTLRAKRVSALPLGGYVNGGKYGGKGVKVALFEPRKFDSMLKPATVQWTAKSGKSSVLALGDSAQSGIHAIRVEFAGKPYYWGFETDAWGEANKHEIGSIVYGKARK